LPFFISPQICKAGNSGPLNECFGLERSRIAFAEMAEMGGSIESDRVNV